MRKTKNIIRKRLIEKETSSLLVNLQPYFGLIGSFVFANLFYALWKDSRHIELIALALSISAVGLTIFTWITSRARKDIGRVHSTITMLCVGAYIVFSVIFGPFSRPLFDVWILGGITLCFSWNIRTSIKNNEPREKMSLDDFFENNNLEGTKLKILKKTSESFKAKLTLKRGKNTFEDVQRIANKLASFFRVPLNGIRIKPNRDDASEAYLTVVRQDMLNKNIEYSDELNKGKSYADPIYIGVYEDSEPAFFKLHSDELGANHLLIMGMNGSGKSVAATIIFTSLFHREDGVTWVIDTAKGQQTLRSVAPGIDWIINDDPTANVLFRRFKHIIKARADYLGSKGLDKWKPGCGLTFIHLHIEEASGLIAQNPAFVKMMETARSTGIQITASLQRPSHTAVDTAARAQFSSVLCFGVADLADAGFALPDDVIDAGANPAVWRNSKQGYAYLVGSGINEENWVMPLRTVNFKNKEAEIRHNKIKNVELDEVTKSALGDLYKQVYVVEEKEETKSEFDIDLDQYSAQDDNSVEAEYDEEIQSAETVIEFQAEKEPSVEQARKMLLGTIEKIKKEGRRTFSAPDLKEVVIYAARSRAWVHKELQKLVNEGKLEKDDFDYIILK